MYIRFIVIWKYRQLRARRALLIFKDFPLRTRRALMLYKVCCNSTFRFSTEHLWIVIVPFWLSTDKFYISSAESQKGAIADQRCFVENQKGAIAIDFVPAIAPFWFSTEHLWSAITPFWLSTDNMNAGKESSFQNYIAQQCKYELPRCINDRCDF